MPASTTKKIFVAFALVGILLISSPLAMAVVPSEAAQVSFPTIIESGSMVSDASYIVFTDGNNYFAKNGTTGAIEYKSSSAATVLNEIVGRGVTVVKPGDYEITEPIIIRNDTTISAYGAKFYTNDPSLRIFSTPYADTDLGRIGVTTRPHYDLTAPAYIGQSRVYVSNAPVAAGDYIYIRSTAVWINSTIDNGSGIDYPTGDGEIRLVASVTDTYIDLKEPLIADYDPAYDATIFPVAMDKDFIIQGAEIVGAGNKLSGTGLALNQLVNITIRDCTFRDNGYSAISLIDAREVTIDNCKIFGSEQTGLGYGISLARSTFSVNVENTLIQDCRHGHSTGQTYYGIPHYITFTNCVFRDTGAERQHPSGIYITYKDCLFQNTALTIQNPWTVVDGCKFYSGTITIGSRDMFANAHNVTIRNCEIIARGNIHGMLIYQAVDLRIVDNMITGINYTTGNSISAIDIYPEGGEAWGTYGYRVQNVTIQGNNIYHERWGINLYSSHTVLQDITIASNTITTGQSGIVQYSTGRIENLKVLDNTIRCGFNAPYGNPLILAHASNVLVNGNYLEGANVIDVQTGTNSIRYMTISNNVIRATNNDGGVYFLGTSGQISNIKFIGNDLSSSASRGLRMVGADNCTIIGNTIRCGSPIIIDGCRDMIVDSNVLVTAGTKVSLQNSPLRVVINGVGTNGAFDPAVGGEWKGYAYEGLFVTWDDGVGNKMISCYRGGSWLDWTVS